MKVWHRLDRWAARVNPGLVIVAVVLALVDGSLVLANQATRPLPMDRASIAAVAAVRSETAFRPEPRRGPAQDAKIAEARPPLRAIYASP